MGRKGEKSSNWKGGVSLIEIECKTCGKLIPSNQLGYCGKCVGQSKKYREILSKALKGNAGGYRKGSGRGKRGWYKGYFCDSSWELAYVIYNLDHDIIFERNKKYFNYKWQNKEYKYLPDFIFQENYIEIKGYFTKQFEAKVKQFPKDEQLIILNEKKMQIYLNYCKKVYGKDFIKMYE